MNLLRTFEDMRTFVQDYNKEINKAGKDVQYNAGLKITFKS